MRQTGDRLRRAVRKAHLWLGLGMGGLFVLLGLTGSILVFYPELDALMHPEIRAEGSATPDWDQALMTLRTAYPEKQGPWRLEVTGAPGALPARYYKPSEREGYAFRPMMVWLSRDGNRIIRRDYWGEYAVTFIYDLHYRFILGETGGKMLGWSGFLLLASLLSGIWAWWPRGSWRKALRFKRNAPAQRSLRDGHKLVGLSGALLLIMLTITGIMLELPEESDAALNALGFAVEHPSHVQHSSGSAFGGEMISPSQAVDAAMTTLPGARLAWIETPSARHGVYRMRMQVPGDPSYRFPHSLVWVGGATGKVLAVHDARNAPKGTTVNNWVHPFHDGSAGGTFGRAFVAIVGLFPLALFVTGWLRWKRRRGKEEKLAPERSV